MAKTPKRRTAKTARQRAIRRVAIVGAGTIGSSWAAFFASRGLDVRLYDANTAGARRGMSLARGYLRSMATHGIIPARNLPAARARITRCAALPEAVDGVQLVQESILEDYTAKQALFSELDRLAPAGVILASSSSGLLMSRIQAATRHPGRCVIAHPFNPPHLMPLVEIVPGRKTSRATVTRARDFYDSLGKVPVVLSKEVPGHIANRFQAAIWREAIDLVLQGVASVEDVDKALWAGPGPRWAFMGQHLTFHLGGGDAGYAGFIKHLHPTFASCWRDMAAWKAIPKGAETRLLRGMKKVIQGRTMAELRRWRDRKAARVVREAH